MSLHHERNISFKIHLSLICYYRIDVIYYLLGLVSRKSYYDVGRCTFLKQYSHMAIVMFHVKLSKMSFETFNRLNISLFQTNYQIFHIQFHIVLSTASLHRPCGCLGDVRESI